MVGIFLQLFLWYFYHIRNKIFITKSVIKEWLYPHRQLKETIVYVLSHMWQKSEHVLNQQCFLIYFMNIMTLFLKSFWWLPEMAGPKARKCYYMIASMKKRDSFYEGWHYLVKDNAFLSMQTGTNAAQVVPRFKNMLLIFYCFKKPLLIIKWST